MKENILDALPFTLEQRELLDKLESYKPQFDARSKQIDEVIAKKIELGEIDDQTQYWIANRAKSLGGSEVGVIMEASSYKTPYELWLEKTSNYSKDMTEEQQIACKRGQKLEDLVAEFYVEKTGAKILTSQTLQSPLLWWLTASLDRVVLDKKDKPTKVLEIKTATMNFKDSKTANGKQWGEGNVYSDKTGKLLKKDSQIPKSYYYQVMTYMLVTGLKEADVAVLFSVNSAGTLKIFTVEFDPVVACEIVLKTKLFFCKNILDCSAPEIKEKDIQDNTAYKEPCSELMLKNLQLVDKYNLIASSYKEKADAILTKIKEQLGLKEELVFNGKVIATYYRSQGRTTYDIEKLKLENKDNKDLVKAVDKYKKVGDPYRTFKVNNNNLVWAVTNYVMSENKGN